MDLRISSTNITDAGLQPLQSLQNLRTIDVGGTPVSSAGKVELARALPNCKPAAVELWQDDYTPTKEELLAKLKEKKWHANMSTLDPPDQVTGLSFHGVHAKTVLRVLKEVPDLKKMVAYNVVDADLLAKELPKLPKLERLYISESDLTDVSLVHLGKLTNLVELSVHGNHSITDARLDDLMGLKKLIVLYLNDTSTTQEGCAALKTKMPHCGIHPPEPRKW
jgi:Leucine-rich repeat (LRR) protein